MQDLRRLTIAILCALLAILQDVRGEIVSIATWNLEWFPGGKPNSSQSERLVQMSGAKDALLDIRADILCLQEVRDWDSVAELVSILPCFQTMVVSRFREMGSSGPLSIQQIAIASKWQADSAWSESFKRSPVTPPRGFSFVAIPAARPCYWSIPFISRAIGEKPQVTSTSAKRPHANCSLMLPKWRALIRGTQAS